MQGVGSRPSCAQLAAELGVPGWVRNTAAGVDTEADGTADALGVFTAALRDELPPLARIWVVRVSGVIGSSGLRK